jgi:hypothetical protein
MPMHDGQAPTKFLNKSDEFAQKSRRASGQMPENTVCCDVGDNEKIAYKQGLYYIFRRHSVNNEHQ